MMFAVDVTDVWNFVAPRLQEVADKTNAEWTIEDIYEALLLEKAFLFMHSSDNESFVVLSELKHPYLKQSVLMVDVAYSKTGCAIDRHQSDLEQLAKDAGAAYLEFSSPRAGFKRVAAKHGYETVCTTYRKKL